MIATHSVKTDIANARKHMGYCPQFDAIIEDLTGRELMYLFSRLRGVPERQLKSIVDNTAKGLLFAEHLDKKCGQYR